MPKRKSQTPKVEIEIEETVPSAETVKDQLDESEEFVPLTESQEKEYETLAKEIKSKSEEIENKAANNVEDRGVIYIGHIPYGFFDEQMRKFFSQFGRVTRVRMARNPKTLKAKHYAFVEFNEKQVAKIVAETMNGYMMFGRVLKVEIVDNVHPSTFKACDRYRHFKPYHSRTTHKESFNQDPTSEQLQKRRKRTEEKQKATKQKLKDLNIDYKLPKLVEIGRE